MLTVPCTCGLSMRLDDGLAGRKVRCPRCFAVLFVTPGLGSGMRPGARAARSDDDDDDDGITHKPKSKRPAKRDDDDEDDEKPSKKRSLNSSAPVSSGKATAALICGLGTCCLPGILMWPAIILGIIAIMDINNSNGKITGMAKAIVGIVFGLIGNGIGVAMYTGGFFLLVALGLAGAIGGAVVAVNAEHTNRMKQIGVAAHAYHDVNRILPTQSTPMGTGLSWRVSLLPHLEQDNLFRQFDQKSGWDSPLNTRFQMMRPIAYSSASAIHPSNTVFQSTIGPNGLYRNKDDKVTMGNVTDGTSNTIFVISVPRDSVVWTRPADLGIDNAKPLPSAISGPGSFQVIMVDGSIKSISRPKMNDDTLRKLMDPRDGQVLNPNFD